MQDILRRSTFPQHPMEGQLVGTEKSHSEMEPHFFICFSRLHIMRVRRASFSRYVMQCNNGPFSAVSTDLCKWILILEHLSRSTICPHVCTAPNSKCQQIVRLCFGLFQNFAKKGSFMFLVDFDERFASIPRFCSLQEMLEFILDVQIIQD